MNGAIFEREVDFDVGFDHETPCVTALWRGYRERQMFRRQNEQVLDVLVAHRARRLLCDSRYFLGPLDGAWLNENWLPRAVGAGLTTCAMVAPVYYEHHMAVREVVNRLEARALHVEYFADPQEARSWLARARA